MGAQPFQQQQGSQTLVWSCLLVLLSGALFLSGCNSGGDSGALPAVSDPADPQFVRQGAMEILGLYRTALLQEDIDRLQSLLRPQAVSGQRHRLGRQRLQQQEDTGRFMDVEAFREQITEAFRRRNMLELQILTPDLQTAADVPSVSFLEVESSVTEETATLEQQTRVWRTTFQLARQVEGDVATFQIAAVRRDGPQVQVITPGRVVAGVLARVIVEPAATFPLLGGEVEVPETGEMQALVMTDGAFHGTFMPPEPAALQPLRSPLTNGELIVQQPQPLYVRLRRANGQETVLQHHYRLQVPDAGVVQQIAGSDPAHFYAVALGPDGTMWGGGTGTDAATVLYRMPFGSATASLVDNFPGHPNGRVEDLAFDALGRLHAVVIGFAERQVNGNVETVVSDNRVVVLEQDVFCSTVNPFDPDQHYPLTVLDSTGRLVPSPLTRVKAAADGSMWGFGSDGGVARIEDAFRHGRCPKSGVEVRYEPVFRRQHPEDNGLLSNSVPAFVTGADGTLWFGTALGLTGRRGGQFTPVPFHPGLPLRGHPQTLEAFFQAVAQAIFVARPLTAVASGAFLEAFGAPLRKEELIFSAVEDSQQQLWVGTLGGGLRRIATQPESARQTLHLTRQDGLAGNIIWALAVGPDDTIWAATEEGLSRIRTVGETVTITNFSSLDGLPRPVHDVAVDPAGTIWLATAGGLFRLLPQGGSVRGVVRDAQNQPLAGADVSILGTPFRTVTDLTGRFVLVNVPPGAQRLQITGRLGRGGPPVSLERQIAVTVGEQTRLVVRAGPQLVHVSGDLQSGQVGDPLPHPLVVAVVDEMDNPVPDVQVSFTVTAGNGTLSPTQPVRTDTQGQAAASWTLGPQAGAQQVTVTAPGLAAGSAAALTFTATGLPNRSTARLMQVRGNNQSAQPGSGLPLPLVVRLEDQFGNPLPQIEVTATVRQGDGMLDASRSALAQRNATAMAVIRTDVNGHASFALQVGNNSNQQDVLVEVEVTEPDADLRQVQPVQFLTIVGTVDIAGQPRDIAVADQVAYIAAGTSGLQVVDISNLRQPQFADPITTLGSLGHASFFNVTVAGVFAYVTTYTPTTLTVLDIRSPTSPRVVTSIMTPLPQDSNPVKIVVQGNRAYVVLEDRRAQAGTLHIFDLTDPTAPEIQSSLPLCTRPANASTAVCYQPLGLTVADHFAYIPVGLRQDERRLLVVDVGNSSAPGIFSALTDFTSATDITSVGTVAYTVEAVANTLHFSVLDLSTPGTPRRWGSVPHPVAASPFTASTIAVADAHAYVASFDLGLQVFDVRNPDRPHFVGRLPIPSVAFNVTTATEARRTFVYTTDLARGLTIVAGPPGDVPDTDGDGVIDFFDAFPTNPDETLDTDQDGMGNHADPDDDNDGFTDQAEQARETDPLHPKSFPIQSPASNNTLMVDANAADHRGNGSAVAPYRSISDVLQAVAMLREAGFSGPITVAIRAGIYSAFHTQEAFPLFLRHGGVTLQGEGAEATIVDAAFFSDVCDITAGGVTLAEMTLQNGINGLLVNAHSSAPEVTLRQSRVADNLFLGLSVGGGVHARLMDNQISNNGWRGIELFNDTSAEISNTIVSDNGADGVFLFAATAEVHHSVITGNAQDGIHIDQMSTATIVNNVVRANAAFGLLVSRASTADTIRGNTIMANGLSGVAVQSNSLATILENHVAANGVATGPDASPHGIQVSSGAAATIRHNDIIDNGGSDARGAGIVVADAQTASVITDNRLQRNDFGIAIVQGAHAVMRGGSITEHTVHGIFLQGDPDDPTKAATADVGLDGEVITLAQNAGFGILVTDDGSVARINSTRIVFEGNLAGNFAGNVIDLAE